MFCWRTPLARKTLKNFYVRNNLVTKRLCCHKHAAGKMSKNVLYKGAGQTCIRKLMANISRWRKRSAERRSWASLKAVHKLRVVSHCGNHDIVQESNVSNRITVCYVRAHEFLAVVGVIFTSMGIKIEEESMTQYINNPYSVSWLSVRMPEPWNSSYIADL